jgi:hypothetical protein
LSLKDLLEKLHKGFVGNNTVQMMSTQVQIKAMEFEESTYTLLCQQMNYDTQAFKCCMSHVNNVEASMFHKKQERVVQAHQISPVTRWQTTRTLSSRGLWRTTGTRWWMSAIGTLCWLIRRCQS